MFGVTLYELYSKKLNVKDLITRFIDLDEINNLELILIYKNILSDNQIFIMYNAFKNNCSYTSLIIIYSKLYK
jgi:hypothetical protein